MIPRIDVSGLASPDLDHRLDVAEAIGRACRATGFFTVVGHGVDPDVRAAAFDAARAFFALPPEAKAAVASAREGPDANRGYDGIGSQRLDLDAEVDRKESFMVGSPSHGTNRWPALAGFREAVEPYYAAATDLAQRLLRGIALSLGLEEGHFEPYHRDPILGLRLLRYPPRPPDAGPLDFGAGAHTDWGGLTVLAQDGAGSLQVQGPDGAWLDVDPDPSACTVNLGDLVEVWTNGRYRSTMHRVLGSDRVRHSIALFCDLDPDAVVECLPTCCSAEDPPRYPPTTVAEHLSARYRATMQLT